MELPSRLLITLPACGKNEVGLLPGVKPLDNPTVITFEVVNDSGRVLDRKFVMVAVEDNKILIAK